MSAKLIAVLITAMGLMMARRSSGAENYLEGSGAEARLTNKLVFRAEQGGIAGTTGRQLTVSEDGEWKYERFRKFGKRPATAKVLSSGKLSPEELATVASLLERYDYFEMPTSMGTDAKVNPQRYSLAFGEHRAALRGYTSEVDQPVGSQILKQTENAPESEQQPHAFGEIIHQLEQLTTAKEDPQQPR